MKESKKERLIQHILGRVLVNKGVLEIGLQQDGGSLSKPKWIIFSGEDVFPMVNYIRDNYNDDIKEEYSDSVIVEYWFNCKADDGSLVMEEFYGETGMPVEKGEEND